jgi:type I restriction enzyme S subunit
MTDQPQIEQRRLKYLATINDEALGEETDPDYEIRYVDIGNVSSEGEINQAVTYRFADAPSRARRRVRHGDVIISTVRTYLQAIAAMQNPPDNMIVSTGFAVVRPRLDDLDAGFCKYAVRESAFLAEVLMRSVGVSYPAINASELGDISICLHPLSQQRKIAAYLDEEMDRSSALIDTKQRLLQLLEEKRRSLIDDLVMRGTETDATQSETGSAWCPSIPTNWKMSRTAWLFRERDERNEPDLPLLEVSINSGVALREFSDDRIESTASDFNTYKVARRGDIVFNKMRMWQGAVGVAPQDGLVSPDYVVAAPLGDMSSDFAGLLFRTAAFSAECARHSHGIVWDRLRLYWEGFREIEVPVPPPEIQSQIVDRASVELAKLDGLRLGTERTVGLLKERRSALITTAVTGQLHLGSHI